MPPLIAITGGIGSGKSAVCRCLTARGLRVYDCDSRAKSLMDADPGIHRRLKEEIAPDTVTDRGIDRPRLASIVFADPDKLARLNAIVHGSVTRDIHQWRDRHRDEAALFVETAILLESNLHLEVDGVWLVEASEETRLRRACLRDSAAEADIRARMARQRHVGQSDIPVRLDIIDNDGKKPLIPQIDSLLRHLDLSPTSLPGQWKS